METTNSRRNKLEKMIQENPEDLFLHYAMGMEFLSVNSLSEAIDKFKFVLQKDPSYTAAYYQLGLLYIRLNDLPNAIEVLEKGIKTAKDLRTRNEFKSALDEIEFNS